MLQSKGYESMVQKLARVLYQLVYSSRPAGKLPCAGVVTEVALRIMPGWDAIVEPLVGVPPPIML